MNRNRLYKLVLVVSLLGYTWVAWNLLHGDASATTCMVKEITGIPCPSCGTTRAVVSLVHGRYVESIHTNPFAVVLAIGLMTFPLWIIIDLICKDNSFFRFYGSVETLFTQHRWTAFLGAAIVIANWAWNISKGL